MCYTVDITSEITILSKKMVGLTELERSDTIDTVSMNTQEVTLSSISLINGRIVNRVLRFFVSPEQFKQYEQNTADSGTL